MKNATPLRSLTLALSLLFFFIQFCQAQAYKDEKLIYLGADGKKTKERNAVVLEQQIKLDDTLYEINFYEVGGPMFKSFHASNPDGNMLAGDFRSYDANGATDTAGSFSQGRRDGYWQVYSKGRYSAQLLYSQGTLLWNKDTLQLKRESDSVAQRKKKDTVFVEGTIFTKVEIESEFPGGARAWLNFLNSHLRYPDDAVRQRIQGVVIVAFVVDKQGRVDANRVFVDRSLGYSLDQEALKVIFASRNWTPAVQNGRAVNAYKRQPIVFRLQ